MYYYNNYNKQLGKDDSYDESDIGYPSIPSDTRNDNLDSDFGISDSYISDSISDDYTFFFKQRKLHYKIIYDKIFSPIILLINNYNKSTLFDYFTLNTLNSSNELYMKMQKNI